MIDKLHTVARDKIRETIGSVGDERLIEIQRAVAIWLGIADETNGSFYGDPTDLDVGWPRHGRRYGPRSRSAGMVQYTFCPADSVLPACVMATM